MSRIGDSQLKQRAEALATILTSKDHPQKILESVVAYLQQGERQAEVINCPTSRQNGRTAVHLAASEGLWQSLEVLLKNEGQSPAKSHENNIEQARLCRCMAEVSYGCLYEWYNGWSI